MSQSIDIDAFVKRFDVIKTIGQGTFGKVELIKDRNNKDYFALKKIDCQNMDQLSKATQELSINSRLSDKNITKIYYHYMREKQITEYQLQNQGKFCQRMNQVIKLVKQLGIIMELAKSSLENEIQNRVKIKKYFQINEIIQIIEKMAGSLCMCQENEISHKDIKPANILIFEGDVFKLSDFGLSAFANRSQENFVAGTPLYMSPQLFLNLKKQQTYISQGKNLNHSQFSELHNFNQFKSDVFSLGLTIMEAATLESCQNMNKQDGQKYIQIGLKKIEQIYSNKFISDIISIMLEFDELKRPCFIQLMKQINSMKEQRVTPQIQYTQYSQIEIQNINQQKLQNFNNKNIQTLKDNKQIQDQDALYQFYSQKKDFNNYFPVNKIDDTMAQFYNQINSQGTLNQFNQACQSLIKQNSMINSAPSKSNQIYEEKNQNNLGCPACKKSHLHTLCAKCVDSTINSHCKKCNNKWNECICICQQCLQQIIPLQKCLKTTNNCSKCYQMSKISKKNLIYKITNNHQSLKVQFLSVSTSPLLYINEFCKVLVTVDDDGTIFFVDQKLNQVCPQFTQRKTHQKTILQLECIQDEYIITCSMDKYIQVFKLENVNNEQRIKKIKIQYTHEIPVKFLIFGKQRILISGHINGDIYFWQNMLNEANDIEQMNQRINIHQQKIIGLFNYSKFQFISVSKEGLIILWEIQEQLVKEISRFSLNEIIIYIYYNESLNVLAFKNLSNQLKLIQIQEKFRNPIIRYLPIQKINTLFGFYHNNLILTDQDRNFIIFDISELDNLTEANKFTLDIKSDQESEQTDILQIQNIKIKGIMDIYINDEKIFLITFCGKLLSLNYQ